jgi:hypothetical protein
MTYTECKEFTKYFLKNYKSVDALKEIGQFVLTIILFISIGIAMAILLYYSWWNAILIVGFILFGFYVSMIWIDWKYTKS